MSSFSDGLRYERDVRDLPDCTAEKYLEARRLAVEIMSERLFDMVCDEVYNAETLEEIINIFKAALWLQRKLIFIVLKKGRSGLMN